MSESINDRIIRLLAHLGISQNEFARRLETSSSRISNITTKRNKPDSDILSSIVKQFRNVSAEWLLLGEGAIEKEPLQEGKVNGKVNGKVITESQNERYTNSAGVESNLNGNPILKDKIKGTQFEELQVKVQPIAVTVDNAGRENIVMVASKAYAGYAQHFTEPEFYADLPTFSLPTKEFRNATYRCFEVSGESMSQTLFNSDWVIGRYCDPWPTGIREGYIYVIVTSETIFVKRVLNRISERGKLVLLSDNEQFISMEIDATEIKELWYVKAKLSFHLPIVRHTSKYKVEAIEADVVNLQTEVQKIKKMLNIE